MKQLKYLLLICIMLLFNTNIIQAQNTHLTFSSQLNCDWHPLDSVVVTNTSQNYHSTTLYYPDTVLELSTNVGIKEFSSNTNMELLTYPNPFSGTTQVKFNLLQAGNTTLTLYDLLGKKIIQHNQHLETGKHYFTLESCPKGYYLLHINTPQGSVSSKLLCHGINTSSIPTIRYTGTQELKSEKKQKLYDPDFRYAIGDEFKIDIFSSRVDTIFKENIFYTFNEFKDTNFTSIRFSDESTIEAIPVVSTFIYGKVNAPCYFDSIPNEKVTLINSLEQLELLFSCSDTLNLPTIDFSEQSILVAKGITHRLISSSNAQFSKRCSAQYWLSINFNLTDFPALGYWNNLIIIDYKIPENEIIYLETNIKK